MKHGISDVAQLNLLFNHGIEIVHEPFIDGLYDRKGVPIRSILFKGIYYVNTATWQAVTSQVPRSPF
jgi:hypothetical protein